MAGWKKAGLMANLVAGLRSRGDPVAFEFSLHVQTLAPWPRSRPVRRLALCWTRGSKRSGKTRAVHPLPPSEAAPLNAPLVYDFQETLMVPATLYEVKAKSGARGHAGFASKSILMSLLEIDPSGKSAVEVGTLQLNLADFAGTDPSARVQRTLPVQLKPDAQGPYPAPQLRMVVTCRLRGAGGAATASGIGSSVGDDASADLGEFDAEDEGGAVQPHPYAQQATPPQDESFREEDEDEDEEERQYAQPFSRGQVPAWQQPPQQQAPPPPPPPPQAPPPLPPRVPSPPPPGERVPSPPLQRWPSAPSDRSASPPLPARTQSLPQHYPSAPLRAVSPPPLPPRAPSPPPKQAGGSPSPPPLPPRAPSPSRPLPPLPAAPLSSPPPPPPPSDALAAEVARLREELAAANDKLAAESARARQLAEAANAAQFKYDLLVDMYTLQMLDQDLLQEQLEQVQAAPYAQALAV